jgi:hypothetical protein
MPWSVVSDLWFAKPVASGQWSAGKPVRQVVSPGGAYVPLSDVYAVDCVPSLCLNGQF